MRARTTERRSWRQWSALTQVERVVLYTRESLNAALWGLLGFLLLETATNLDDASQAVPLLVGGAAVAVLASRALVVLLTRDHATDPLPRDRIAPLLAAGLVLVVVAGVAGWDDEARGAAAVTVIAGWTIAIGVLPDNRVAAALVGAAVVICGVLSGEVVAMVSGAGIALFFLFTARASMWMLGIVRDLDGARRAQSELAVAEERLRFSRDVHDVLGRRLSTIAVQAELAATLAARGDERAPERMLEVRGVAHQALREARELARGYRPTDLAKELEGARSLLRSAGIDVQLDVEGMPHGWHEAAGWVVRESVTNVLRHSTATVVAISYTQADGRLELSNDGARPAGPGDDASGSGLRSLRERLQPLGASLDAGPQPDGRWAVVVCFPTAGPLSAKRDALRS